MSTYTNLFVASSTKKRRKTMKEMNLATRSKQEERTKERGEIKNQTWKMPMI
jgi:hypothetical protein